MSFKFTLRPSLLMLRGAEHLVLEMTGLWFCLRRKANAKGQLPHRHVQDSDKATECVPLTDSAARQADRPEGIADLEQQIN